MRESEPLFGSYGRSRGATFGQLGRIDDASPRPVSRPFGRRSKPPVKLFMLQRERLHAVYAELRLLFADPALPDAKVPFRVEETDGCKLLLDTGAEVRVADDSGMYVFSNNDPQTGSVLTTASEEQLMDVLVSHLARAETAPATSLAITEKLVGRTVADVERALILATLRHHSGNRTHAARALGISLRTLRNKLRSYWQEKPDTSASSVGDDPVLPAQSKLST